MTVQQANFRSLVSLVLSNVLGGVGVASGIAVSALVVASMSSDAFAGVGQALGVLGAGMIAVPLAGLATRRGRRFALTLGYAIAVAGAGLVLVGAALGWLPLLLVGLVAFGAAQATNLQTRYAASELVEPEKRGVTMSVVLWATTIGSVAGPNLSALGGSLGERVGLPTLAGPYLFSVLAFCLALLSVSLLFQAHVRGTDDAGRAKAAVSARSALAWAARHPVARFAVTLLVAAHATMVAIMSMTPLHLGHHGRGLEVIGLVISLHILGMYALSPVFGWLADKLGPMKVACGGLLLIAIAAAMAFTSGGNLGLVTASLTVLGLGWSASVISASVLLANVDSGDVRVPLQGATDALMSYGGAAAAVLSGILFAAVGFGWLALIASVLILPAAATGWLASRPRSSPRTSPPTG